MSSLSFYSLYDVTLQHLLKTKTLIQVGQILYCVVLRSSRYPEAICCKTLDKYYWFRLFDSFNQFFWFILSLFTLLCILSLFYLIWTFLAQIVFNLLTWSKQAISLHLTFLQTNLYIFIAVVIFWSPLVTIIIDNDKAV